ncbi:MAG: LOG family protein [Nanobdellota archaeon]
MKKLTFVGSGVEIEKYKNELPEVDSVVKVISKYYKDIMFGGTNRGLMGKFSESAKKNKLNVISVIPKWFTEKYPDYLFKGDKIILTENLAERKKILEDTDAMLCYPGGVGTFDELFNIIARISLGEIKPVPVLIYNFERFYSPLLLQMEFGVKTGVIRKDVMDFIYTFETVDQLEEILEKIRR